MRSRSHSSTLRCHAHGHGHGHAAVASVLWMLMLSACHGAVSKGAVSHDQKPAYEETVHAGSFASHLESLTGRHLQQAAGSSASRVVAWEYTDIDDITPLPEEVTAVAGAGRVQYMTAGPWNAAVIIDGRLTVWGNNYHFFKDVTGTTGTKAVALGRDSLIYLLNNGTVVAWPKNITQEYAVPETAKSKVVAISSGSNHHVALRDDGVVVAWGNNEVGKTTLPAGLSGVRVNVTAISAANSGDHSMALLENETVVVWGNDGSGQVSAKPAGLAGVSAIAAGTTHCLALLKNGTVVMWGGNTRCNNIGKVPAAAQSGVAAIAAGAGWSMALLRNGSVIAWGSNGDADGRINLPYTTQSNVVCIAAGGWFGLALVQGPGALESF